MAIQYPIRVGAGLPFALVQKVASEHGLLAAPAMDNPAYGVFVAQSWEERKRAWKLCALVRYLEDPTPETANVDSDEEE